MGDGGCKFVLGRQRLENYHYNMDPFIFHPFFIYIYNPFSTKKKKLIIKFCFSNKTTKIYLLKIDNTGTSRLIKHNQMHRFLAKSAGL
jgi:hypothetical protein